MQRLREPIVFKPWLRRVGQVTLGLLLLANSAFLLFHPLAPGFPEQVELAQRIGVAPGLILALEASHHVLLWWAAYWLFRGRGFILLYAFLLFASTKYTSLFSTSAKSSLAIPSLVVAGASLMAAFGILMILSVNPAAFQTVVPQKSED
jgi:hypothetical protein